MDENFLVTIAIPVYQRSGMIDDAIESVVSQLVPGVELLILDNASTDGTFERAQRWSSPQVRVERNPENIGMGMNFLRSIELARGKWFRYLMSDDKLLPGAVPLMVDLINLYPDVDFQFSNRLTSQHESVLRSLNLDVVRIESSKQFIRDQKRWKFHAFPASPNAYCLRRDGMLEMIRNAEFMRLYTTLAESGHCIDYMILSYSAAQAKNIAFIDAPTYCLRVHDGQGSALYRLNMLLHLTGDYVVVSEIWRPTWKEKLYFYPHAMHTFLCALRNARSKGIMKLLKVSIDSLQALLWVLCYHMGLATSAVKKGGG